MDVMNEEIVEFDCPTEKAKNIKVIGLIVMTKRERSVHLHGHGLI